MEVEEHGAKDTEKETMGISCSSKTIPGGTFKHPEEFSKEYKHTLNTKLNTNENPNQCTIPDSCSQLSTNKSASIKKVVFNHNPLLWAKLELSAITGGHGVVKRARVFEDELGGEERSQLVTTNVTYKPEVGSQ